MPWKFDQRFLAMSLASISVEKLRFPSALLSGVGHLFLGSLHVYRLFDPFTFKVFGYAWSRGLR
ncbi:MAG TPA: hypothetical protein VGB10_03315 [Bacteroidota bacterium]